MNRLAARPTNYPEVLRTPPRVAYLVPLHRTESSARSSQGGPLEFRTSSTALHPPFDGIKFNTPNSATRLVATWSGFGGEIVRAIRRQRFEIEYCGASHLLIAYDGVVRQQGESALDGVHRSTLRNLTEKLTFVPAGHRFREWQEPRAPGRAIYLYIEPGGPLANPALGCAPIELAPRLFFENAVLRQTALKLASLIEGGPSACPHYAKALGVVLMHELSQIDRGIVQDAPTVKAGLAGWQQRLVVAYIEKHLAEPIPLADLAKLTRLSLYHFCRAFRQSFGVPPHRFHTARRIDRAKALLADPKLSVTDIALDIGFRETSSFSMAFRKLAGRRPTQYRRSLFDRPDTEEGLCGTAATGSRAQRAPIETFHPDSRTRGRSSDTSRGKEQ